MWSRRTRQSARSSCRRLGADGCSSSTKLAEERREADRKLQPSSSPRDTYLAQSPGTRGCRTGKPDTGVAQAARSAAQRNFETISPASVAAVVASDVAKPSEEPLDVVLARMRSLASTRSTLA